jgi:membrane protein
VGVEIVREALRIFSGRGARFLGAAVAFYALLSAAPLFVVVLRATGAVFGKARAESALWAGLGTWLAPDGVATVRTMTERLDATQASGSILGTVLVVYGSTRLFRAMRRALNVLWGVDLEGVERSRGRVKKYAVRYGAAFGFIVFAAALVGSILLVKATFAVLGTISESAPSFLWALDAALSGALAYALFLVLLRFLPETDVTWREAAVSALVATLLFAFGSELVSLYLRHKHVADLYEGASAVVLVVLWVYYSTQVFFLGACVGAAMHAQRTREAPLER